MVTAGVDEAGRGPLAGPVVAAAVILDPNHPIGGLIDSKKLSASKRERLYDVIEANALAIGVGLASPQEIDEMNILQASLHAMSKAVDELGVTPDKILCDGLHTPPMLIEAEAIVRGDDKVECISAASIIAKVHRDRLMMDMHREFPQFGFDKHKGYPTKAHREALREFGPTIHHRQTFNPVKQFLDSCSAPD